MQATDPDAGVLAWIELDGEVVDGFRVRSREVIEVALRDEQRYLRAFDQDEEKELALLYPHGSARWRLSR